MKQSLILAFTILFLILTGCSDDASPTSPTNGGLGVGNGGTGSVTISISSKPDQQGGTIFTATPSVAVTLSKLTVSVTAQQYTESFQFDGTSVVNGGVTEDLVQYPANAGVASGQQWTFQFEGTLASNNQAYNVTSNYTVP